LRRGPEGSPLERLNGTGIMAAGRPLLGRTASCAALPSRTAALRLSSSWLRSARRPSIRPCKAACFVPPNWGRSALFRELAHALVGVLRERGRGKGCLRGRGNPKVGFPRERDASNAVDSRELGMRQPRLMHGRLLREGLGRPPTAFDERLRRAKTLRTDIIVTSLLPRWIRASSGIRDALSGNALACGSPRDVPAEHP
jgi:hypothetical protein